MNTDILVDSLLKKSNLYSLSEDKADDFTKAYIKKLVQNVVLYVDSDISVGDIEFLDSYALKDELSQEITGIPSAYSALDGDVRSLTAFAENYSHLGIAEYDSLCSEALLDFLNLHNGLFIVHLSEQNMAELSLTVPKQNGEKNVKRSSQGQVTVIPITFSYGVVKFLLVELPV